MEEAIHIDNRDYFGLWAIEVAKQIVAAQSFELARVARESCSANCAFRGL